MPIRKMRVSDIPIILSIARNEPGFRVAESAESSFWTEEQLTRWIEADQDVLLVAVVEEMVVGFVLTAIHHPTGKVTWENQLVVPHYRGRGIAAALTDEMERQLEALKAKGTVYINFLTKLNNPHLAHYEKIGYERGDDFAWFGKFI
jgi:ribosomal protein S18 acetylase RimI-like enzyme